ncbi:unnamed protein product [Cuscuta campestris]|uniref:RIN4 pathogenic type III effector avirulence factor Avr cleavage site domain-containing protein n=1 Tax=Cuscuta campestris TaxID=132261 RepID=A0A484K4Q9_9ASTE|nr:unnamed protein product [Cuscuta campestris]
MSASTENGKVPLPKFGDWDVNNPSSAEGFTVIFNKARDEKKTGCTTEAPGKDDVTNTNRHAPNPSKPRASKWKCW